MTILFFSVNNYIVILSWSGSTTDWITAIQLWKGIPRVKFRKRSLFASMCFKSSVSDRNNGQDLWCRNNSFLCFCVSVFFFPNSTETQYAALIIFCTQASLERCSRNNSVHKQLKLFLCKSNLTAIWYIAGNWNWMLKISCCRSLITLLLSV